MLPLTRLRASLRTARRPKWWQELGFVVIAYFLYSLVRNAVPSHEVGALHRAASVLAFEQRLHLDPEHWINSLVARTHWLAYTCDYYYATLHFVVTIGVLVWLYARHPLRYRAFRTVLLVTCLVALLGFWLYSLAPPRMLTSAGFVDTLVKFHTWGSLASPSVANQSNQFAAMPSLHIGWSLWCALAVVCLARRRWVRVLGALYPFATCFVILGTANHYVLDALGGVATLSIAVVLQRLICGRRAYLGRAALVVETEAEPQLIAA